MYFFSSNTIEDEKQYLKRCTLKRSNAHLFCALLVSVISTLVLVKFLLLFFIFLFFNFFLTKQSILDIIRSVLLTDVM